ncbi:MAG: hypothetical protein ABL958_08740 [Bdellovibrionia bacterium]
MKFLVFFLFACLLGSAQSRAQDVDPSLPKPTVVQQVRTYLVRDFPVSSSSILYQVLAAQSVHSLLQKDPLALSEMAHTLVEKPHLAPSIIMMFNASDWIFKTGTNKLLTSRFGAPLRLGNTGTGLVSGAVGLAGGFLVTRFAVDLYYGERFHPTDEADRAKIYGAFLGLGAGIGTDIAITAGLSRAGMITGPWTKAAILSGVAMISAWDYVEDWYLDKTLYKIEHKRLNQAIEQSVSVMNKSAGADLAAFDTNASRLADAFVAERSALLRGPIEQKQNYLAAMDRVNRYAYRQIKLAEWILAGTNKNDPDYKSNILNWTQEKFPLDFSVGMSLDGSETRRKQYLRNYIEILKKWRTDCHAILQNKYLNVRDNQYESIRRDPRFTASFANQLGTLLNVLDTYTDPTWKTPTNQMRSLLADPARVFEYGPAIKAIADQMQVGLVRTPPLSSKEDIQRCRLLITMIWYLSADLAWHHNGDYFRKLIKNSMDLFEDYFRTSDTLPIAK